MNILDQAEQLRQQAISLLLQERKTIDQKLGQLGYDGEVGEIKKPQAKDLRSVRPRRSHHENVPNSQRDERLTACGFDKIRGSPAS